MLTFTLRLDELAGCDTASLLSEFLKLNDVHFSRYVIVHEKAQLTGKLHFQGWVETCWSKTQWYTKVKGHFPHDRSASSKAVMQKEEYKVYVLKDGDVRFTKGVHVDELAAWREQSYTKAEANKRQEVKEKKKESSGYERIRDYCIKWREEHPAEEWNGWQIAKLIMQWYCMRSKCEPNDFQIRSQAKSIWYYWRSRQDSVQFDTYCSERARSIIGDTWVH